MMNGNENTNNKIEAQIEQEIRFAVVMYGGVSLAIYMNGMAQELLRLVRASAIDPDGKHALLSQGELSGSEIVYRKLAQILSGSDNIKIDNENKITQISPLKSRFVIDILSGSSAGGINAVFLSKAMVCNQSLNNLKRVWIEEGDIDKLLNFSSSSLKEIEQEKEKKSLLNSRRMYYKLLESLEKMDDEGNGTPLVDELDLYITATDFGGLPLKLKLADVVADEKRHKNTYHFSFNKTRDAKYEDCINCIGNNSNGDKCISCLDFKRENNYFLAFAARCTSSYPFAFSPMVLNDISKYLKDPKNNPGNEFKELNEKGIWKKFYTDYLLLEGSGKGIDAKCFGDRGFGDGGDLDNKPFTQATRTLNNRTASSPVKRKLLYLEPNPDKMEDLLKTNCNPRTLEEVSQVLIGLGLYETIREDIEEILNRNQVIEKVNRILARHERDLLQTRKPKTKQTNWQDKGLNELLKEKGANYGGYHRLKVSTLTDDIALWITSAKGLDEKSAYFPLIRDLVKYYRDKNYKDNKKDSDKPEVETENKFLFLFDLNYRIRRLRFVLEMIDSLCNEERLEKFLKEAFEWDNKSKGVAEGADKDDLVLLLDNFREKLLKLKDDKYQFYIKNISFLRVSLKNILQELISEREKLCSKTNNPLKLNLNLSFDNISNETLNEYHNNPDNYFTTYQELVEQAEKLLENHLRTIMITASCKSKFLLDDAYNEDALLKDMHSIRNSDNNAKELETFAKNILDQYKDCSEAFKALKGIAYFYYDYFDDYDMVRLPLFYSTSVGEATIVDIHRMSPMECNTLYDETCKVKKLAGTELLNFSSFLEESWRKNDMLWGRLDGAERLINILIPECGADDAVKELKKEMIAKAQLLILIEELSPKDSKDKKSNKSGDEFIDLQKTVTIKTNEIKSDINSLSDECKKDEKWDKEKVEAVNKGMKKFLKSRIERRKKFNLANYPKVILKISDYAIMSIKNYIGIGCLPILIFLFAISVIIINNVSFLFGIGIGFVFPKLFSCFLNLLGKN